VILPFPLDNSQSASPDVCIRATAVQTEEVGRWKSVKVGKTFCTSTVAKKEDAKKAIPFSEQVMVRVSLFFLPSHYIYYGNCMIVLFKANINLFPDY